MKAIIDRLEGNYAVVLFGEDEIRVDIPLEVLPYGVREGDVLSVSFEIDMEATRARKEKALSFLEKLKNKEKRKQ